MSSSVMASHQEGLSMRRNLLSLFALALGALLVTSGLTACESTGGNTEDTDTTDDTKDDTTDDTKDDTKDDTEEEEENSSNEPAGDGSLGSACSKSSDCDSGLSCETSIDDKAIAGGVCTKDCSADSDCGGDGKCPSGKCMMGCDATDTASCERDGWSCDLSGSCVAPGSSDRGENCTVEDCASGLACGPDGLCTVATNEAGADCESGEVAKLYDGDKNRFYCSISCSDSNNTDCGSTVEPPSDPNDEAAMQEFFSKATVCRLGLKTPRCQAVGTLDEGAECTWGKGFCNFEFDCKLASETADGPTCVAR